jgi:hypothetical protein
MVAPNTEIIDPNPPFHSTVIVPTSCNYAVSQTCLEIVIGNISYVLKQLAMRRLYSNDTCSESASGALNIQGGVVYHAIPGRQANLSSRSSGPKLG